MPEQPCKKKKCFKKVLLTIATIVVVFIIACFIAPDKVWSPVLNAGINVAMSMTSGMKHRAPGAEEAKFEVNASDFSKEFTTDVTAATRKYLNQPVGLSGTIIAIDESSITLGNIVCTIDSTALPTMTSYKVGDTVKIQGLMVTYNDLMDEIALSQCVFK